MERHTTDGLGTRIALLLNELPDVDQLAIRALYGWGREALEASDAAIQFGLSVDELWRHEQRGLEMLGFLLLTGVSPTKASARASSELTWAQ